MHEKLANSDDIVYLQRLLHFGGFDCGEVDGIKGPKTRAAMRAWDRAVDESRALHGALDARSEEHLSTLLPRLHGVIRAWMLNGVKRYQEQTGNVVKIICGTRTYAEQNALYNKRPRVTKARAGSSMHNFGLAFDIGIFDCRGNYLTDNEPYEELYKVAGAPDGMEWGGLWASFKDTPHYQVIYPKNATQARKQFTR